jgi:hypothetical protein
MRVGKFNLNPRTGRVELNRPEHKPVDEILREVKGHRRDLIRAHSITDEELRMLIIRIVSGTRNVQYLARGTDYARLKDLIAYIVREYSW